jgi:hypothetical protein
MFPFFSSYRFTTDYMNLLQLMLFIQWSFSSTICANSAHTGKALAWPHHFTKRTVRSANRGDTTLSFRWKM